MMSATHSKRHGFTIVELLIIIVVISILAAITIVSYNNVSGRATVASLQSDLEKSFKQIEMYKIGTSTTGAYPPDLATANLKASTGTTYAYNAVSTSGYCLTATNNNKNYFVTSLSSKPTPGTCAGLVGWWTMNGNGNDLSGNGINATITGATPTAGQDGSSNGGYQLGNAASWINIGNPSAYASLPAAFSYSVWAKRTSTAVNQWPVIMGAADSHTYYAIRTDGYGANPYFEYGTSPYAGATFAWFHSGLSTLPLAEWHHITSTYDGTSIRYYWDGTLLNTAAAINPTPASIQFSASSGGWVGVVDDARIYNRALSTAEVAEMYAGGAQ